MKSRRKPRANKRRTAILVLLLSVVFTGLLLQQTLYNNNTDQETSTTPKAAIIDQLGLFYPNSQFIQKTTNSLQHAGYDVDYYPVELVTVEFYRTLPAKGYSLLLLRVHSLTNGLFTSEPYSETRYVYEQLTDQVVSAYYSLREIFFAISPHFILSSMKGEFSKTTVIMMGCNGLETSSMAEAFTKKGAQIYVSWNDPVTASHTDLATTELIEAMVVEKLPIRDAVKLTMEKVGPDPKYNSRLVYYPA